MLTQFSKKIVLFVLVASSFQNAFAGFNEEDWSELSEIIGKFAQSNTEDDSVSPSLNEVKKLNVELPITAIREAYLKYGVIPLRPSQSENLLAGCGRRPFAGGFVGHYHEQDTIDPNFEMNPSVIGFLGSEGFTNYLHEQNKQYDLIETEGLGLPWFHHISSHRKMLSEIAKSIKPGGAYRPLYKPEIEVKPGPPAVDLGNKFDYPRVNVPILEILEYFRKYEEVANRALEGGAFNELDLNQEEFESLPLLDSLRSQMAIRLRTELDGTPFISIAFGPIRVSLPMTDATNTCDPSTGKVTRIKLENEQGFGRFRDFYGRVFGFRFFPKDPGATVRFSYLSFIKE